MEYLLEVITSYNISDNYNSENNNYSVARRYLSNDYWNNYSYSITNYIITATKLTAKVFKLCIMRCLHQVFSYHSTSKNQLQSLTGILTHCRYYKCRYTEMVL